ncbi:hypothetical protein ACU8MW_17705 [Rhizobium leguminosarum]
MDVLIDHFPVFEANQVLSSRHLNDVFDYLDQQTRWTRSHLIGIGIVCGLEIKLDTTAGPAILLSKGCGVTSEGYLIVEPDDVSLVSYRAYTTPTDVKYPPFATYPLWELFPSGEPSTTLLDSPSNFLADKAVVLFLELKKEGLRNCSPNSCDDKGSEITATVRRLLIERKNLDAIIAAAEGLGEGLTSTDIDKALSDRLNLPDIRLRRFDVLNSNPVTSNDVYEAFFRIFRSTGLASAMDDALSAAYIAFEQLLKPAHPTDPFANFAATFRFLDVALTDPGQVHFLQYYVDLFDDLVRAYDEFRWKGAELICACCPPEGLFPRHLMLGLVNPDPTSQPGHYRQRFLASPAVGGCSGETEELLQLFARLVEMTECFTSAPVLPTVDAQGRLDPQIRITPSTLGDRPLATKAIPYYYAETGTPPLYRLWNGEKTRRNRANQNLGYRSDEYSPVAPNFVLDPLRYDLEPYNFLRIEGHLGKPYLPVMGTLIALKSNYRLPIDIIALHTGAYDENQPVDLGSNDAIFQDLEALYDALREDLLSSLAEAARQVYEVPTPEVEEERPADFPKLPLLKRYVPTFKYTKKTIGAGYEKNLTYFQSRPYAEIDQSGITIAALQLLFRDLFGPTDISAQRHALAAIIYYVSSVADVLPNRLEALVHPMFLNRYQDLLALLRFYRSVLVQASVSDLQSFAPIEQFVDLCEAILFGGRLESINSLRDEYLRRIAELRKRQVLSNFLTQHPGIQHKAGVPVGGTFIVVHHGDAGHDLTPGGTRIRAATILAETTRDATPDLTATDDRDLLTDIEVVARRRVDGSGTLPSDELLEAITRIASNRALVGHAEVELLIGSLTGKIPLGGYRPRPGVDDTSTRLIAKTVSALPNGVVIADFYLPYRVSSEGLAVNYVLPKEPPVFTIGIGCTSGKGVANVSIEVRGGVAPYDVAVDDREYRPLINPLSLQPGRHKLRVRDADGTEATEQEITVADALVLEETSFECSGDQFVSTVAIKGGTAPFRINGDLITGTTFTTKPAPSGSTVLIEVVDSRGCSARIELTHECVVVPPPTFTAAVGCTGQKDMAPVTITVQDGTAPYQIKVDNAAYQPLSSPLSLAVGQHSLKLRDSVGVETAAQPVTVATQISISDPKFHCNDDGTYTATVDIAGGTPPYDVNGTLFAGGAFTTDPTPSGKQANIDIRDAKGCTNSMGVIHECEPPCDLPCGGVFIRRGHRMWMPDPGTVTKYLNYELTKLSFVVWTESGNAIDLGGEIEPILQAAPAQLTTGRFPGTVRKWLKQINELIGKNPDLSRPGGPQWLETSYEAADPGRLGTLWIDHFECLPFEIKMNVLIEYRHPNGDGTTREEKLFIYSDDGGTQIIVDGEENIRIPPFEGVTWNKCPPVSGPTPICNLPDIKLTIETKQSEFSLFAIVTADPDPGLTYLWEVQDADPALGHSNQFKTEFLVPGQKRITVTAFTKDGCDVSETIFVDVR